MIYCILCVGFYNHSATPYAVLALAIDFTLRLFWGGSVSVIAMTAAALSARFQPVYTAGPPKHFAILCCVFFSVFSAGLYLSGYEVGGAVILAGLAGAVGLEGLADWCVGCFIFSWLMYFGLVSKYLYTPYLQTKGDRIWSWNYTYTKTPVYESGEKEHLLLPGQIEPTPVDVIRKKRWETEYKLQDIHVIKHIRIDFFIVPMTIASLAYVFQVGGTGISTLNNNVVYQALAIVAVIVGLLFLTLYLLRCIVYPSKVAKELDHPLFGNFFACLSITCLLFGLLFLPQSHIGGGSLIWIGAIFNMILTIYRLSSLFYDRIAEDYITPSIMIPPVANFLAALAFVTYHTSGYMKNQGEINYVSLARFWFATGILYAIVFFTISLRKTLHDHQSDVRLRPLLYIWLATASIIGPAYYAVSGEGEENGKGAFYQSMWCISLIFFAVFACGWLRNFFSYTLATSDMSNWVISFSYCVFALNTVQYYLLVGSTFFAAFAIITVTIACATTAVSALHTLYALIDGSLFTPRAKWNPLTFLKITHEAFRFVVPKMNIMLNGLTSSAASSGNGVNIVAMNVFIDQLETLFLMFSEHARHEDEILYPRLRRYFPEMMEKTIDEEHGLGEKQLTQMKEVIASYRQHQTNPTVVEYCLKQLSELLPEWSAHLLPHLRQEEETLTVAARKYLTVETSVKIIEDCFDLTSMNHWRKIMPFVIHHLPMLMWKTRYVKTLLWAVPYRAHEIGLVLYHGCDSVTWTYLAQEMPELIPRGLPGFKRIY